jgi:endonuclease/exonuclease/phosphatase family metal-dependent hydrolase
MRVLTWNLFHGRSVPGARRSLVAEFSSTIAGLEWDVALLQEVPPWWPPRLAASAAADQRTALTSRNSLLPVRRLAAERFPDVMRAGGGGANAILVRGQLIRDHRIKRLRRRPERRVVHAVELESGVWVANLHAQVHSQAQAESDIALAAATVLGWAGDLPVVLGGDFNVRSPHAPGLESAGGNDVDFVLVRGLRPVGSAAVLDRGTLSDHAPVVVEFN